MSTPNLQFMQVPDFEELQASTATATTSNYFEEIQESTATATTSDYNEVNRMLDFYENAALEEDIYLLSTSYKSKNNLILYCGLSPVRTFEPAIKMYQHSTPWRKITIGSYEWTVLMGLLGGLLFDFFKAELDGYADEYEPIDMKCSDYITVTQMIYEDVKLLEIKKFNVTLSLYESDVEEILTLNTYLIRHKIDMLNNLGFILYYNDVLDIVRKWCYSANNFNPKELLIGFCNSHNFSPLATALREYIFYYEHNVLMELNNK